MKNIDLLRNTSYVSNTLSKLKFINSQDSKVSSYNKYDCLLVSSDKEIHAGIKYFDGSIYVEAFDSLANLVWNDFADNSNYKISVCEKPKPILKKSCFLTRILLGDYNE